MRKNGSETILLVGGVVAERKMGVPEDINWLKSGEGQWGEVFRLIAEHGPLWFRQLKHKYRAPEWWSLKSFVEMLVERGLVEQTGSGLALTEHGKKVFEAIKTTEELEAI